MISPPPQFPAPLPELDDDTLAFVRRVFQHARTGEAGELSTLLGQDLPPNLRNERGDSLLMLACYHGHAAAARALLEAMFNRVDIARLLLAHGADPLALDAAGMSIREAAAKMGAGDAVALLNARLGTGD